MTIVSRKTYDEFIGARAQLAGFHDEDEFSEYDYDLMLLVTPDGVIRRDTDENVSSKFPTQQLQAELMKARDAADGYLRRKF